MLEITQPHNRNTFEWFGAVRMLIIEITLTQLYALVSTHSLRGRRVTKKMGQCGEGGYGRWGKRTRVAAGHDGICSTSR